MKSLFYILILIIATISCNQNNTSSSKDASSIVQTEKEFKSLELMNFMSSYLKEKTGEAMLLDVRTPPEYDSGYIKGAVLINYLDDDIDQQLNLMDKTKTYYIYCSQGSRGDKCMDKMKKLGFDRVFNLQGGYEAYTKATFK